jgi:predicted metalloprotease with PDZ domain
MPDKNKNPKNPQSDVHYHVSVDPNRHELRVRMHLTGSFTQGRMRLEIPTWVPGNYTFTQLGRDLFEVRAVNTSTGKSLAVSREGWQAFHVDGGDGDVTITYRAWGYSTDLGEPSGIVDNSYAVLLGTRYLHSPAYLGACTVSYELPEAWKGRVHHPSGATQSGPDSWRYPSYEILLDTPVTMGNYDRYERVVSGTPFYFVFVDRGVGFEAKVEGFVDQLAAIAKVYHRMFGSFPFEDYTFVMSLNPQASWGLEHLTSTMCGLGPDVFTDPDQYAIGVRVCAHELFHAWNVRRLRPSPLLQVAEQLTSGSFTEGLWISEGFTRYYEFLSSTRIGVYSPDQFFSAVVGYLEHLRVVPAYERVSGVDSSLTTYLNHSPKYSGRPANCIDYYDKGMLIAFDIDATLRLGSSEQSLDHAFRGFYEKYVTGGPDYAGFTTADAMAYFERVQPGLGAMIEATALNPGGLTTEAILGHLGFVVNYETVPQLGIMFLGSGAPTLYNVLDNSPAGDSGLAPEDVITGVNGFIYTPAAMSWAASQTAPVTLTVLRGHRLLSFTMTPTPHRKIAKLTWNGTAAQAKRIQAWLERPFAPDRGQVFKVDFYENFHGIETVM